MDTEDELRRKIRKHRNTLYIIGTGTIVLGIWNTVKMIIFTVGLPQELFQEIIIYDELSDTYVMIYAIMVIAFTAALMGLYLFAGDRARAEGLGKNKNGFYVGVIFLLSFFHASSVAAYVFMMFMDYETGESILRLIVSIAVDLTAAVMLAEMGCSAVMIRVYERRTLAGNE